MVFKIELVFIRKGEVGVYFKDEFLLKGKVRKCVKEFIIVELLFRGKKKSLVFSFFVVLLEKY